MWFACVFVYVKNIQPESDNCRIFPIFFSCCFIARNTYDDKKKKFPSVIFLDVARRVEKSSSECYEFVRSFFFSVLLPFFIRGLRQGRRDSEIGRYGMDRQGKTKTRSTRWKVTLKVTVTMEDLVQIDRRTMSTNE